MITIDDFKKVEIKVGEVLDVTDVTDSEKILKLTVSFGPEMGTKTIFSGIKKWYEPQDLLNKKFLFVTNLEPKVITFGTSEGMILAADTLDKPILLSPVDDVPAGSVVK